jgi:tetratricopeptide (TPR) repeat protein
MTITMMPSMVPNTQANPMDTENVVIAQVLQDLKLFRLSLGDKHVKVAETWNSLGLIRLHMQQDAKEAKPCFEEALRIFTENDNRTSIAVTLNDLGYCFERLGQHDAAVESYKRAREIFEAQKFSDSHPRMLSTQLSLSRLLRE